MIKKLIILGLLIPLFVVGCSTSDESVSDSSSSITENEPTEDDTVHVTSVSLNKTSLEMYVGDSPVTLTAKVLPTKATNKNVNWLTSNSDVATISDKGKITAVSKGTAVIMAHTQDGGKTASCNVTVYEYPNVNNYVLYGKFNGDTNWSTKNLFINSFNTSEYMLQGVTLKANDVFKVHMYQREWYGYSNIKTEGDYASFTNAGTENYIKVLSDGTYDIYCNPSAGTRCIYLAKQGGSIVNVSSVSLNASTKFMAVGSNSSLTATISPSNATNKTLSWVSTDYSIVSVNNGQLTANANGSATITVTTLDGGKTATCRVFVTNSGNPDYYLSGKIHGENLASNDYRYPGIKVANNVYEIPNVYLSNNDTITIRNSSGALVDGSSGSFYYNVYSADHVNIYLDFNASYYQYLRCVDYNNRELTIGYPSGTNTGDYCVWVYFTGDTIDPQWIKTSDVSSTSTSGHFEIPKGATRATLVRASRFASPDSTYDSIGYKEFERGPFKLFDVTYRYDVF